VPVTAKLSRKFYEKLGDDVANELVEWFNAVDATYRSDLRELNELNFARFDAKLEQRVAELGPRFDSKLEQRLAELESRLTRRMFGFWVAQAATTAALVLGVVKLTH
jgi:BMFP domain-containing protein YqiC